MKPFWRSVIKSDCVRMTLSNCNRNFSQLCLILIGENHTFRTQFSLSSLDFSFHMLVINFLPMAKVAKSHVLSNNLPVDMLYTSVREISSVKVEYANRWRSNVPVAIHKLPTAIWTFAIFLQCWNFSITYKQCSRYTYPGVTLRRLSCSLPSSIFSSYTSIEAAVPSILQ